MPRRKLAHPKKLTAVFEPDDGGWLVQVPQVQGCCTWGRSIAEGRSHIREALATCVDVFGDAADDIARNVEIVEEIKLPGAAKRLLKAALDERKLAEAKAAKAQATAARAARKLTRELGLSVRDAGQLLGLSHERVRQLTAA